MGTADLSPSAPHLTELPRLASLESRPGSRTEMGFNFASRWRRSFASAGGPSITPHEYLSLVAGAGRTVLFEPMESDTSRLDVVQEKAPSSDPLETLVRRVQRDPSDPRAHRRLGIAHLEAGNCREAVRHLQIAVNLLLAQATGTDSLRTVCARLELALLLPVVIPLCLKLGRRDTAQMLISRVLVTW